MDRINPTQILYVSYNGVLAGVGRSQILPYVEALSRHYRFTLVTVEQTWDQSERARMRRRLERCGITWHPLRYHAGRSLAAKAWDAVRVLVTALAYARRRRVRLVHARSYIPAVIAWVIQRLTGVPYLFDMRGRLIDEYLEEGYWPETSARVRWMRRWERRCLRDAAGVVVLTHEARRQLILEELLPADRPVAVIPCCADTARFAVSDPRAGAAMSDRLGLAGRFVLAYVGSPRLGELPDDMLRFFLALKARRPEACLLILTAEQEAFAAHLSAAQIAPDDYRLLTVPHDDMPAYLQTARAAINFVRATPAKRASCSIKKAECLAAGLPLVLSAGAEDHDALLAAERVGVLVSDFQPGAYAEAVEALLRLLEEGEQLRHRCQRIAESWYGLSAVGVPRYASVYERLIGNASTREGLAQELPPVRAPSAPVAAR